MDIHLLMRGDGPNSLRVQPDAPPGQIPKLGETWRPKGRKALVGAVFLAPIDAVRSRVPEELEIVEVVPNRTLATVFVADYGPGSTLEYHEFGIQPALVRFRGRRAAWNSTLIVDSEASRLGGEQLGVQKELADFDWQEEVFAGGRVRGVCTVRQSGREIAVIRYRQGRLPLPSFRIGIAAIRNDSVITCVNHLRGRHRCSRVRFEFPDSGPLAWAQGLGRSWVETVATEIEGEMGDEVKIAGYLPHRNPKQLAVHEGRSHTTLN